MEAMLLRRLGLEGAQGGAGLDLAEDRLEGTSGAVSKTALGGPPACEAPSTRET